MPCFWWRQPGILDPSVLLLPRPYCRLMPYLLRSLMPPHAFLSCMVFVWSTLSRLMLLPPPPVLHMPKSCFLQVQPQYYLSTISSLMKKKKILLDVPLHNYWSPSQSETFMSSSCCENSLCPALESISHSVS